LARPASLCRAEPYGSPPRYAAPTRASVLEPLAGADDPDNDAIGVNEQGAARVVDFDRHQEMLVASGMSAAGRYGFTKLSMLDSRFQQFVPAHDRPVRDIKCSPRPDGLVLTASMDRRLRIVSTASNAVVQSYALNSAGWACCWDASNPHRVLAGLQDGTVAIFDMRHGQAPWLTMPALGERRLAVHSLDTMPCRGDVGAAGQLVIDAENVGYPTVLAGTLENLFLVRVTEVTPDNVNSLVVKAPYMDGAGMAAHQESGGGLMRSRRLTRWEWS